MSYAIVGGNDNAGQPGFAVSRTTKRAGQMSVASEHDYRDGKRFYSLNVTLSDDGTAPYGPAMNVVPVTINATLLHVPVPPLFLTHPNGTARVEGVTTCVSVAGLRLSASTCRSISTREGSMLTSNVARSTQAMRCFAQQAGLCRRWTCFESERSVAGTLVATIPCPDDHDDPLCVNITYAIVGESSSASRWLLAVAGCVCVCEGAGCLPPTIAAMVTVHACAVWHRGFLRCVDVWDVAFSSRLRRPAGDPQHKFRLTGTYPETVVVAPNATISYFAGPLWYNLTIQANDTRSPPQFGNYTLFIRAVGVNTPPLWTVARTFQCVLYFRDYSVGIYVRVWKLPWCVWLQRRLWLWRKTQRRVPR